MLKIRANVKTNALVNKTSVLSNKIEEIFYE